MNAGRDLAEVAELYYKAEAEGVEATKEQAQKGYDWLMNLYKTPHGLQRKNNPFVYREEEALDSGIKGFTYDGNFNAGNAYMDWYTPMYTFIGNNGTCFQYYVAGGKIMIIG